MSRDLFKNLRTRGAGSFVSSVIPKVAPAASVPKPSGQVASELKFDVSDSASLNPEVTETSPLLDRVVANLKLHEKLKYPDPPYTYARRKVLIDGDVKDCIYVTYDGSNLTADHLRQQREHALAVRQHSVVAGVLNAMKFSKRYLAGQGKSDAEVEAERVKIEKLIENLLKEKIKIPINEGDKSNSRIRGVMRTFSKYYSKITNTPYESDEGDKVNSMIEDFIVTLAKNISNITGIPYKQVLRDVRNSERYFVANYRNDVLINETKIGERSYLQVDVAQNNTLTDEQKLEFLKIHMPSEKDQPDWYLRLPDWEKVWLRQNVPSNLESASDRWNKVFDKIHQSSAMSHIPGIQNVRMNYLLERQPDGTYNQLSKSLRTGTFDPYDIPRKSRKIQAANNTGQVVQNLYTEAKQNFESLWGKDKDGNTIDWANSSIRPLVYVHSLLSDVKFVGGSDNSLVRNQIENIKRLIGTNNECELIMGNDPVNFLKMFTPTSGVASVYLARRWVHTDALLRYSERFTKYLKQIPNNNLTREQIYNLQVMQSAHNELTRMRRDTTLPNWNRNFNAFKAAYSQILVETLGGISSFNCKSGKDRTGLHELYCSAMRIYFQQYGTLPKFDDDAVNRKKFIDIFVPLFNSMKAQEAAAGNTPGSFGLKDSAKMLCPDIQEALGLSYKNSNELSNMNKPPSYKKDEAKEAKRAKKFTKKKYLNQANETGEAHAVNPGLISVELTKAQAEAIAKGEESSIGMPVWDEIGEVELKSKEKEVLGSSVTEADIQIMRSPVQGPEDIDIAPILAKASGNSFVQSATQSVGLGSAASVGVESEVVYERVLGLSREKSGEGSLGSMGTNSTGNNSTLTMQNVLKSNDDGVGGSRPSEFRSINSDYKPAAIREGSSDPQISTLVDLSFDTVIGLIQTTIVELEKYKKLDDAKNKKYADELIKELQPIMKDIKDFRTLLSFIDIRTSLMGQVDEGRFLRSKISSYKNALSRNSRFQISRFFSRGPQRYDKIIEQSKRGIQDFLNDFRNEVVSANSKNKETEPLLEKSMKKTK